MGVTPQPKGATIPQKISRLHLYWLGRRIFLSEFFRALRYRGITQAIRAVKLINFNIDSEIILKHNSKGIIHFFIPPIPSPSFSRHLRSYNDALILEKKKLALGDVLISVTERCPFNCWYCSARGTQHGEMELDNIRKIISILKGWGTSTIGFTGGEPLLRTDIDKIIKDFSNDFTFIIFTSGYGLNQKRAGELKEYGLFYIAISLDHYDEQMNNRSRGSKDAFQTSIQAIKNAKQSKLYTIVQTVVTKELLADESMNKFLKFIKELNADELLLLEPLATGKLFFTEDGNVGDKNVHNRLKELHKLAQKDKSLPKIYTFAHQEDNSRLGCGAGIQHAFVDTAGNLWPCNFLPISLGSILEEPDLVYHRLEKYFHRPCSYCILMKYHKELNQLAQGTIPIPFEKVERFLSQRIENIPDQEIPKFYQILKGKR